MHYTYIVIFLNFMSTINIFGSTGFIGQKTLNIINNYFPKIKINLLLANKNFKKLLKQAVLYKPKYICLLDNSKYLLFSDLDIVKTLSELIDTSFPTLNFINPVGIQIIDDITYKRKKTFTKQKKETNFFNYFRNIVAAFLTLILLVFVLQSINKTDLKSLNTEVISEMIEEPVITDAIATENPFEFYNAKSHSMINVFDSIVTEYGNVVSILSIVDGVVSVEGGDESLLSLLNGVDPNAVKQIDLSKNKVVYKIDSYLPSDLSKDSTPISNFLNWILDIEEIEFKIIDGVLLDREVDNVILRIDGLELSNEIIDQITNYNNFIMRKILFTKADNSIHFYITVLS